MSVVANIGSYSYLAVLKAVATVAVPGLTVSTRYTNENEWSITTNLYGEVHQARVLGGGIVVSLAGSPVGNFSDETQIGLWLVGESL